MNYIRKRLFQPTTIAGLGSLLLTIGQIGVPTSLSDPRVGQLLSALLVTSGLVHVDDSAIGAGGSNATPG